VNFLKEKIEKPVFPKRKENLAITEEGRTSVSGYERGEEVLSQKLRCLQISDKLPLYTGGRIIFEWGGGKVKSRPSDKRKGDNRFGV